MSGKYQFTSRTKARKRAADVVFEADQRGMGRNPEVLRDLLRERKVVTAALTPLPEYSVRIIEGVASSLRRIDDLLTTHVHVKGLDLMPAVDLAVMRVAVWEMLENSEDVPRPVAIDEAVAIVKSISTDSSPSFVNAVLDAVRRDLESPAWSRSRVTGEWDEEASSAPVAASAAVAAASIAEDGADVPGPSGDDAPASDAVEPAESALDTSVEEPTDAVSSDPDVVEPVADESTDLEASGTDAADDPWHSAAYADEPSDEESAGSAGDVDVEAALAAAAEILDEAGEDSYGAVPSQVSGILDGGDRGGHPTLADIANADLSELDELLDEY